MNKFRLLFFGFAVLMLSCHEDDGLINVIEVDTDDAARLNCKKIFKNFEYVYLSPGEAGGYITEIGKLAFDGNDFYIFQDEAHAPGIFKFNRRGRLVFNVTSREEGSGKFIGANDILLNGDAGLIEVLDAYQSKIVSLDALNGGFVKDSETPYNFRQFVGFGEGNYGFYAGNNPTEIGAFNIYIANGLDARPKSFIPIRPYLAGTIIENKCFSSYPSNGSYLYRDEFSNIIWRITTDGANKAYVVDFGKNWFDEEQMKGLSDSGLEGKLAILNSGKDKVQSLRNLEEFDRKLFFQFYLSGKMYWNFYDKNAHQLTTFYAKRTSADNPNNIDGGPIPGRLLGRYKDYLIFQAKPELVYSLGQSGAGSNDFKRFARAVPEDGNPVIILAKLKPEYQ